MSQQDRKLGQTCDDRDDFLEKVNEYYETLPAVDPKEFEFTPQQQRARKTYSEQLEKGESLFFDFEADSKLYNC